MIVHTLNPISDSRWDDLVRTHPAASIFHTRGWLHALQRTYGFDPLVFTTSAPDTPLANGIVVCAVRSWLTGRRLVSVPFADHCDPLVGSAAELDALVGSLYQATEQGWRYVELRPSTTPIAPDQRLQACATYRLHRVDLRGESSEISSRMHASGVRRKIRRAEREGLRCDEGRSKLLLNAFYELFLQARRRHNSPPPPKEWFANLIEAFGDDARIRVAWSGTRPIGSIMTLRHGKTLVYKYGGSDAAAHNLGAMPWLFWRAIEEARREGLEVFDLGRSDLPNAGLTTFKERLGGVSSTLTYFRASARPVAGQPGGSRAASRVFAWLPRPFFVAAGRVLYRHIG